MSLLEYSSVRDTLPPEMYLMADIGSVMDTPFIRDKVSVYVTPSLYLSGPVQSPGFTTRPKLRLDPTEVSGTSYIS